MQLARHILPNITVLRAHTIHTTLALMDEVWVWQGWSCQEILVLGNGCSHA